MLPRRAAPGICSLVLATVVACSPAPRDPTPPRGSPFTAVPETPQLEITVARRLARAPKDCPGPEPQHRLIAQHLAPLIGNKVVAAGFYARFDEPDALHASDSPRTRYGYRVKVLWAMPARQPLAVRVAGRGGGDRLWFNLSEGGAPSATLLLDPEVTPPSIENPRWREFPSYLYFPAAGCYVLEASWGDGRWSIGIGLGK